MTIEHHMNSTVTHTHTNTHAHTRICTCTLCTHKRHTHAHAHNIFCLFIVCSSLSASTQRTLVFVFVNYLINRNTASWHNQYWWRNIQNLQIYTKLSIHTHTHTQTHTYTNTHTHTPTHTPTHTIIHTHTRSEFMESVTYFRKCIVSSQIKEKERTQFMFSLFSFEF